MADDFDRQSTASKPAGAAPASSGSENREETEPGEAAARLEAAERKIAELEAGLQEQREEATRNRDLWMRERAEADNFKKRLQRDKAESIRFANEGLIRELLEILDNLERAVEHAGLGGNGRSLVEGVQMVVQMFHGVLSTHGVSQIDASEGTPFDPNVHDALASEDRDDLPPNTVIREELRGYRYHDRLLRAARVVVSAAAAEGSSSNRGGSSEGEGGE